MAAEDVIGMMIPLTYVAMLAAERFAARRAFPAIRWWRLRGSFFVVILLAINATAPSWLPSDWLAAHRIFDGTRLGTVGGVVAGYLAVSLANYAFHRAEHASPLLWRVFHQLHHSPQRMDMPGAAYTTPWEVVVSATIFALVTTFLLGLSPLAIAITGYVGAFFSMFQHWNIRTPRWLGYIIERPESHGVHHQRDLHAFNYSDLPLWDIVFGTFRNPHDFTDEVGFEGEAAQRVGAMLVAIDVNRPIGNSAPAFAPIAAKGAR